MLEALDRYKFGIMAAVAAYMSIFMYLNMDSYEKEFVIYGYEKTGNLVAEEEFQLKPENIEVPSNYDENILNMANNVNDDRESSLDEFYENKSPRQVAQDIRALEQQMKNDAGGAEDRAKLQAMIDARKEVQRKMETAKGDEGSAPTDGGDKKYKGKTMVDFGVNDKRGAYESNKWYVRNPGYKCDNTYKITVFVDIEVSGSGLVTSARVNEGKSSGASSCTIREALKYAKMSKFEPNGSSSSGWISYIFMPK